MVEENEKPEEETTTEEQPEEKTEETPEEEKRDLLEEARNLVGELRPLIERGEELAARQILGGQSEAGQRPVEKKEETNQEYAKRISEGRL